MRTESRRRIAASIRWTARGVSLAILSFWGFFIVAHLVGSAEPSAPSLTAKDYLLLTLMGAWLTGLVVAWRYERAGGITALIACAATATANQHTLSWPFPVIPIAGALFLASGWTRARITPRRGPSEAG